MTRQSTRRFNRYRAENAKKNHSFPNIRQINRAFLITSTLFHHPWNSGKPRHPFTDFTIYHFSEYSDYSEFSEFSDYSEFSEFSDYSDSLTANRQSTQTAADSQARQDSADDSRQRLQDEFPRLLLHSFPPIFLILEGLEL